MSEPVTVQIVRVVRPGLEATLEAALHDFIASSLSSPDQQGVHVLRPGPGTGSREYTVLRHFANVQARDDFFASPLFARWQQSVAPLVEGEPHYETLCGLETWFALPGAAAIIPPPRWKMALVTLLAVYPLNLLLQLAVAPFINSWPLLLKTLVMALCMVLALTWLIMPNLTRLMRRWLHPVAPQHQSAPVK
jgi:antibiotic biosynthesis monooxygenase (ABM) superfamily enzyme